MSMPVYGYPQVTSLYQQSQQTFPQRQPMAQQPTYAPAPIFTGPTLTRIAPMPQPMLQSTASPDSGSAARFAKKAFTSYGAGILLALAGALAPFILKKSPGAGIAASMGLGIASFFPTGWANNNYTQVVKQSSESPSKTSNSGLWKTIGGIALMALTLPAVFNPRGNIHLGFGGATFLESANLLRFIKNDLLHDVVGNLTFALGYTVMNMGGVERTIGQAKKAAQPGF